MSAFWQLAALFYLLFPLLAAIGPLRAVRPYVEPANPVRPNMVLHRGLPGRPGASRGSSLWPVAPGCPSAQQDGPVGCSRRDWSVTAYSCGLSGNHREVQGSVVLPEAGSEPCLVGPQGFSHSGTAERQMVYKTMCRGG